MQRSTKDGIRSGIGVVAGVLCFWRTKDGVATLYEEFNAACSVLERTTSHCPSGLYPTWQWTTIMSSIGAFSVGIVVWYVLQFGPLGNDEG